MIVDVVGSCVVIIFSVSNVVIIFGFEELKGVGSVIRVVDVGSSLV